MAKTTQAQTATHCALQSNPQSFCSEKACEGRDAKTSAAQSYSHLLFLVCVECVQTELKYTRLRAEIHLTTLPLRGGGCARFAMIQRRE